MELSSAMHLFRIVHLVYKALWDHPETAQVYFCTLPVVALPGTWLEIRYHLYSGCTNMPFMPE